MKLNVKNKKEFTKAFHKIISHERSLFSLIGSPESDNLEYLQFMYNGFIHSHSEPLFRKDCIILKFHCERIYNKCKTPNALKTEIKNFCDNQNLSDNLKLDWMDGFSIVLGTINTKNKKFSEQVDEFLKLNQKYVPSINNIIDSYI